MEGDFFCEKSLNPGARAENHAPRPKRWGEGGGLRHYPGATTEEITVGREDLIQHLSSNASRPSTIIACVHHAFSYGLAGKVGCRDRWSSSTVSFDAVGFIARRCAWSKFNDDKFSVPTHLRDGVESHPSACVALIAPEQHSNCRYQRGDAEPLLFFQRFFVGAAAAAAAAAVGVPKHWIHRASEVSPCFGYRSYQAVADQHSDRPPLQPPSEQQVFRRPCFFVVVSVGAVDTVDAVSGRARWRRPVTEAHRRFGIHRVCRRH